MIDTILLFLKTYTGELGGAAALVAIVEYFFRPIRSVMTFWKKPETVALDAQTLKVLVPNQTENGPKLTVPEFIRIRRELKAELEVELQTAGTAEKDLLRARIAELEKQITNPEAAHKEQQTRIAELEALLERSGNEIGGDRLTEAREALERGDFSIADQLFAEIEDRRALEVKEAARAAFGRGEIAEEQVRWGDAADHYARAARLDPNYDTLIKAGTFLGRAGRHADAIRHKEQLVDIARQEFGAGSEKTATALNNLAESYRASARYDDAEPLYREALEIDRQALGTLHPDYAVACNNLAELLHATGRFEEAETLFREALEIGRQALGTQHPTYALNLNNLAGLLLATGRFEEAELLFQEALEIDRQALGTQHPDYAIHLNNLAGLFEATGRFESAEPLYREVLEIDRQTLGTQHPEYANHLSNLAELLRARGWFDEAEPLYREALEIDRKTLGTQHPHSAIHRINLAGLLKSTGRFEEAEPLFREAVSVMETALGAEHPDAQTMRKNLEIFLAERPA